MRNEWLLLYSKGARRTRMSGLWRCSFDAVTKGREMGLLKSLLVCNNDPADLERFSLAYCERRVCGSSADNV